MGEQLCCPGMNRPPLKLDPRRTSSHPLSQTLDASGKIDFTREEVHASRRLLTGTELSGLVGMVLLYRGRPPSVSPLPTPLHAVSSLCPASRGQPVPDAGGMGDSVSDKYFSHGRALGKQSLAVSS